MLVINLPKVDEEFGKAVDDAMKARGLSNRGVMIKSRGKIDYGTVQNMRSGLVPKKGVVIDFAITIGEDINHWLTLAGYDPIPTELIGDIASADRVKEQVAEYLVKKKKLSPKEIEEMWKTLEEKD